MPGSDGILDCPEYPGEQELNYSEPIDTTINEDYEIEGIYEELVEDLYWNPFYQHGMEAEISHPDFNPAFAVSDSSIGFDFKKTPEGERELIEVTPLVFGMEGFSEGYRWGDISGDVDRHLDSMFGTFHHDLDNALLNFENKKFAADHLNSARDYDTVETFDGDPDSDLVYIKNPREDCGEGIEVVKSSEFDDKTTEEVIRDLGMDLDANLMIEENVPSEGVEVDGETYDSCMRYVVDISLTGEGMNANFLGGYWRTAPEPKGSDTPIEERRIANLKDGMPVQASPIELREATEKAAEITQELYSAIIQQSIEEEITPQHSERYLPDIDIRWKNDIMRSSSLGKFYQ